MKSSGKKSRRAKRSTARKPMGLAELIRKAQQHADDAYYRAVLENTEAVSSSLFVGESRETRPSSS